VNSVTRDVQGLVLDCVGEFGREPIRESPELTASGEQTGRSGTSGCIIDDLGSDSVCMQAGWADKRISLEAKCQPSITARQYWMDEFAK
jgi:hypothetical protein